MKKENTISGLKKQFENFKKGKTKFRVTTYDSITNEKKVQFETYDQMKSRHADIERSAQELKQIRKELNMSQKELAETLRVNTRTLQGWESSRFPINPTAETLLKVIVKHPQIKKELEVA